MYAGGGRMKDNMNTSRLLWIIAGLLAVALVAVTGYFLFNKVEKDQPQDIFMSRYSDFYNVLKKPGTETRSNEIFEDGDFNILMARDFISKDSWKRIFITGPSIQFFLFQGMFMTALFDDNTRTALNQTNAGEKEIGSLNISRIDSNTIGVSFMELESILYYTRLVRENDIWKFDFSNLFSDLSSDDPVSIDKLKNTIVADFLDWLYVANNEQIESFKNDLLLANMDNNNPLDNLGRLEISKLDSLLFLSMQLHEAEIVPVSGTAFGLKGKYSDIYLVIQKNDKLWTVLSIDRYKQKSGNLSQKNTNSSNNKTVEKVTKNQQPADIFIERYRDAYKSLQSSKEDPDYEVLRNNSINSRSYISMSSWQALFLLNHLPNVVTRETDRFKLYFDTGTAQEIEKVFKESVDRNNLAKYDGQDRIILRLPDQGKFIWVNNGLQLVYENNTWKFNLVNLSDKNPTGNMFSQWFQHPRLTDLQKQPFRNFMEWLYTIDEEGIVVLEKSIKNVWNGVQGSGQQLIYLANALADERNSIRVISEESFVIDPYNVLLVRKGNYWTMTAMSDR